MPMRTSALVGGTRSRRPKTSVMKPGVSRSVPPTATITPSAASRPGKRPAAIAALKRRQAERPWWRSSSEPSTASASSSARVGSRPIASPTLMIT